MRSGRRSDGLAQGLQGHGFDEEIDTVVTQGQVGIVEAGVAEHHDERHPELDGEL